MKKLLKFIEKISFKQKQKDIIIGTLLGDSKIVANKNRTASIIFEQSNSHKLYLESIFIEMNDLIGKNKLNEQRRFDKRYDKLNILF
jgi:predicted metal-dependent peptidase